MSGITRVSVRIAGCHDAAWHAELVQDWARQPSGSLSRTVIGGQQQRVAIGRALAVSRCSARRRAHAISMRRPPMTFWPSPAILVAQTGCGLLMVTHSARLAATLDRQSTSARG